MKMNKILLCTAIYLEGLKYIHDYIDSINSQTNKSFDILFIVDDFLKVESLKNINNTFILFLVLTT